MGTNIPVQLTRFIGREQEISDIAHLLTKTRLLTVTGAGGCGKTRLAIAVATQVKDNYADSAVWVDLASLTDGSLVSQTVAKAINVKEQPDRSVMETLLDSLSEKQILLIMDNCEHLIAACARLVHSLLSVCPELHILATSREPLALAGESVYPVPSLSLPSAGMIAERSSPVTSATDAFESLFEYEAVALFIDRAAAIVPGYTLTPENARAIADICIWLDGMPLAIELAAARVNVLTAVQIASRLDNRFTLLKSDQRDAVDQRHQTLRAAIDWSYDLLTAPEQLLLQRLSVFAGGCSLNTAEMVCAGEGIEQEQMLNLLSSLINKSLVTAVTLQRRQARYTLLETIRQYAQEKLAASGKWSELQNRHLQHFLQLAEETRPKLTGQYQQLWLNWLEDEYANLRAALSWSLESGDIESGLRIAIAIYGLWTIRNYSEEALAWIERLLARADEDVPPVVRANALAYAAFLAGFRGNNAAQAAYGRKAADLAEALGAEGQPALAWARAGEAYARGRPGPLPSGGSALAWVLVAQACGARAGGDYETELAIYKKVIQLYREAGERYLLGICLIDAGIAAWSLGKYEEARVMVDEGLPLIRAGENPYRIAMTLNGSGDLARCEGNFRRAEADYEESIALLREIDAVRDLASLLHNLGYTCLHLGNVERAHALFSESMALQRAQQNTPGVAECLMGFAAMAVVSGLPAAGTRLLAAAVAIGGERVATTWIATKMEYEHFLTLARASLTEQGFQAEQAAGRTLSLDQAVEYAQNLPLKAAAQKTRKKPDDLTPREREVATLVAQAKSNEEIAEELVLSKRTVEKHIANIRSKLGFTQRAQIVRWAIENGLVDSTE